MFIFCFGFFSAAGQGIHQYSLFFFNPSQLNPSLTGIDGQGSAFLAYRKQWSGIQGAPVIGSFSYQNPGKKRMSLGLGVENETAGLLKGSAVRLSSSYNLPVGKENNLRFGMSFGASWNRVDVNGLSFGSPDADPVTAGLLQSNTAPLLGVGLSYHTRSFHLGLSAPALFRPDYLTVDAFSKGRFDPMGSLIFHASHRIYLSDNQSVFDSYFNYRINQSIPAQMELAGVLHLKEKLWLGAGWKQQFGLSAMAGFNLSKTLSVGYAYAMKTSGIGQIAAPSHEVQLGILLGQRLKGVLSYSFINSEKQSRLSGKTGAVAYGNRKPAAKGYVPLQKGAVIAKANPQKSPAPAATKPPPPAVQKPVPAKPAPSVAAQKPAEKPSPPPIVAEKKPEVTPETRPVVESPKIETAPKPAVAAKPVETKPAEKSPVIPEEKPKVTPETRTVAEVPKPAQVQPQVPVTPVESRPKDAENPVAQTPAPVKRPDADKPRLTQQSGIFDEPAVAEQPAVSAAKPLRPVPVALEGEDVAGLHGTRHTADSLQEVDEAERLGRLSMHQEDPKAPHTGDAPHADRHEFVRRGGHQSELKSADYVIVGSFKTEANARRWVDGLKSMGFPDVSYGFLTERAVWYVHFAGTNDLQQAKSVRDNARKLKVFRDAWLLTVQE